MLSPDWLTAGSLYWVSNWVLERDPLGSCLRYPIHTSTSSSGLQPALAHTQQSAGCHVTPEHNILDSLLVSDL